MKKSISIVFLFLAVSSACCFAVTQPVNSKAIPLVGIVGKFHQVSVQPITASSGSPEGMPFDVVGADVQKASRPELGRKIATWSLLTNYYPATLSVTVSPLRGVVTMATLNYELYVKYIFSCFDSSGNPLTVDGALVVSTSNGNPGSASVHLEVPAGAVSDSYISINNSPIRFLFTDATTTLQAAPDDEYIGTVTFTVISD